MDDHELLRSAPPAKLDGVDVCRTLDVPPEFRAADEAGDSPDDLGTMVGVFSGFDNWYEINSWFEGNFIERIAPGAFKRAIKAHWSSVKAGRRAPEDLPVRVLLEHGFDPTVGDKPLGVPDVLEERDQGAYAEVPLFDTSYNRDLAPALRSNAYGQSFRFQVLRDEFVEPDADNWVDPGKSKWSALPQRTIKEVRLIEFGPTVFPANPATDAGLRSTTDEFYERLRRRDSAAYDDALARTQSIRIPAKPEDPAPTEDPPLRHSEDSPDDGHSEDSPQVRHSDADSITKQNRSNPMDPMTVEERTARQSEIRARLTEIDSEFNGAELDEERQTEWDALTKEDEEHDRAIASDTARKAQLRRLAENPAATERVTPSAPTSVRRPDNIYDLAEIRNQARSVDDLGALYRDNAMRAVEQARFPGAEDRARAQAQVERLLDSVDDDRGTLARRILVTGSPTYDRAFGKAVAALSTNGLTAEEQRALSLGTPGEGGFAVPFQLDPTVILTSDGSVDPLRQISRVEPIVGKEWQGVASAGITVTRHPENDEADDDAPTLTQPTVKPSRVQGFVPFSVEIDQDWTAMRSEMTRLLADAKMQEEAGSFTTGDGVDPNPQGVVTGVAAVAGSRVAAAGTGAITSEDVYALDDALPPRFRARARFLANKSTYNAVRQFASANDGSDLWVRLAQGLPPELIGYSAHEASEMDGVIESGGGGTSDILLLGDFQHFIIVDRVGMSVELVPHLFGTTRRPTGQRGLFAIWRNGSKVLVPGAFRILRVTSAV